MFSQKINYLDNYLDNRIYHSYQDELIEVKKSLVKDLSAYKFLKYIQIKIETDYFETIFNLVNFNDEKQFYFSNADLNSSSELIKIEFSNINSLRALILNSYSSNDEMRLYKAFFICNILKDLFQEYINNVF